MLENHSTLFDFAADLTRSHAASLRDDPARVAPPEYGPAGPGFEELPRPEQLDIAETICRRPTYRDALAEAMPESKGYDGWLKLIVDARVSDSEIGRVARELILAYLGRVAAGLGDDLAELA
ncbi:MAG TPA: hypothetical protein VFY39_06565 [Gammaproteobacteria bacterium]|nr:hypothetical protein [Gammaproteobacteria bacterium]